MLGVSLLLRPANERQLLLRASAHGPEHYLLTGILFFTQGGARARAPARSAPAAERLRWAGAGGSTLAVSGCAALDEGEPAEGAGGRGSFRLVDNLDGLAGRGAALRAPGLVRGFIILAAGGFGALFLR